MKIFLGGILDDSKKASLNANTEKTKYMFMSNHQTTVQYQYINDR
jgi:hypothetical protein